MGELQTGFRLVPWEERDAPNASLPKLDLEEHNDPGEMCDETWNGWTCTRPRIHDGTCRASGLGRQIFAEWNADA